MAKKEILTLEEVSHYLRMSKDTIYRMVQNSDLPGFKVGSKNWRFKKESIDEWLTNQEKQHGTKAKPKKMINNKMKGGDCARCKTFRSK